MRHTKLEHRFGQYIPEQLQPGVLYISMEYATAAHSCCCGCGLQVITPFTPKDWKLTFDGESVSLWPSIGNWNFPCRSHYIIRHGSILDAEPWGDKRIEDGRQRDERRNEKDVENKKCFEVYPAGAPFAMEGRSPGLWGRLKKKVRRKRK